MCSRAVIIRWRNGTCGWPDVTISAHGGRLARTCFMVAMASGRSDAHSSARIWAKSIMKASSLVAASSPIEFRENHMRNPVDCPSDMPPRNFVQESSGFFNFIRAIPEACRRSSSSDDFGRARAINGSSGRNLNLFAKSLAEVTFTTRC